MKRRLFPFFVLLLTFHVPRSANAASTAWQTNPHGRVRLISAHNRVPKTGEVLLGFQFQPISSWYLYWKDPGESGIPPKVDWTKTRGLARVQLLFAQPSKFILPGDIIEYGYEDETVYPVRATVIGDTIKIQAKLSYLTCDTSCVPYTYTFNLDLPIADNPEVDQEAQNLIQTFLARVPPKEMTDSQIKSRAVVYHKIPGQPLAPPLPRSPALFGMLLVAFLGGLILNVMPCVLPVLSIKLTGFLQHSGQSSSVVVKSALASAAGILVSFEGLALAAILVRKAGHAIGWGIQFQNPYFVIFLFIVVLLFALNLWGVFEINAPRWVGHFATTYGYHETLPAHFVSGLFATLLATPCSAPFLGTALGFALSQSSRIIVSIFFAVGTGMALPYLLLAVFPQSIFWLPKPGNWMLWLKKLLSILLLATASWLGWVLFNQLKPAPLRAPAHTGRGDEINSPRPLQGGEGVGEGGISWVDFDESTINRYLREGKPVFVDVTADWCVTCKYNERFVLNDAEVMAEFKCRRVVMMRADWTNGNAVIAAYLMKNGRAGIPFYALYYPHRQPITLSEFLTKEKVLRELRKSY